MAWDRARLAFLDGRGWVAASAIKNDMKEKRSTGIRIRRARCKHVLAILNNRLETMELLREEIYPPLGDLADEPQEMAVVRWHGIEVLISLGCVVFLRNLPPEPQWVQEARAKAEKARGSEPNAGVPLAIRADRDESRTARRHDRRRQP